MKMFTRLLLSLLLCSTAILHPGKLFAHTVDYFNCCGYTCSGSTMSVSAHVSNTNNSSKYNWQFRDYSKTWKCFVNGSNTINGVAYTVSGVSATGTLNTSPTLSIANAQSSLNDVEIRLLIADGGTPCASGPSYTIWGGDKSLRLHVLAGSDCSAISTFCSMGGCIGNTLSCTDGYYGGFEIGNGSIGIASTDYTLINPGNSSTGQYAIINNPSVMFSQFPSFAPKSGNYMMYVDGSNVAGKRAWYKTVSVVKDNMYEFSAWVANANSTNNQKAIVRLKVSGATTAEATKTVTATAGDWQYVKVTYAATQTGSVTLSISDDNLSAGDNDFVIDDICFKCNGSSAKLNLGNLFWNDRDGDGKKDLNEPTIAGATISLYTDNDGNNLPDGAAIRTTQTNAQGQYSFTSLTPGRYIASVPILLGYQLSPNNNTQDISPYPDLNVDNVDKLVRLVGPNAFGGVLYTNAITLSVEQEPTNDGDGSNGNLTFDLAECGNSGIGDFVWNDTNGNGIQDAGEHGINNVLVTITFEDGTTASVATHNYNDPNNANAPEFDGYYDFINLGGGTYKVTFATPSGLFASPALQGTNRAKDSNPINGTTSVTIAPNQSDFTIDAGFTNYIPPVKLSLGNLVWNDLNNNGKRDSGEPGLSGWTVMLFKDANGDNYVDSAAIASTTTASDGTYSFNNLASGNYIVVITLQGAFMQGSIGDGTPNDDIDDDNNGIGTSQVYVYSRYITLTQGGEPVNDGTDNNSNFTLDFGVTCHTSCHNDCTHTCTHPNCGHNSCKNDCTHTCTHPNCGHNSCKNDCTHTCTHPNCGHNSCKNDCTHTCTHPNCGHNSCKNNCTHTGCGHPNCGHNSCKNNCTHTGCGHPNCGHNSCTNNCTHTGCGHPNCGHNSCTNNCTHTGCGHPNCGHNSCNNNCTHTGCGHPNCGHNSCTNNCTHTGCGHPNCGHNSCNNNCTHTGCGHPNCGHNSCTNNCTHTGCGHPNCGHNSCNNNCTHTGCGHANCSHNSCKNNCNHVCSHPNCAHNSCKNNCLHFLCGHSNCRKLWFRSSDTTSAATVSTTTSTAVPPVSTVTTSTVTPVVPATPVVTTTATATTGSATVTATPVSVTSVTSATDPKLWSFGEIAKSGLSVYPNPANDYFMLTVNPKKEGKAVIRIVDITGKVVLVQNTFVTAGTNTVRFAETSKLRSGTYAVQLILNGETLNQKLVIAK